MKKRVIFTGGGTGGHIYPLLEVASLIRKRRDIEILYVGGKNNLESKIVPQSIEFAGINVGKLRREISLKHFKEAVKIANGLVSANKIIKNYKPNLIFAKGGYVSLPILVVASTKKIPVICHESDSVFGLTNKFSARIARKICVGFPTKYYPNYIKEKVIFTGVPIRSGFYSKKTVKDRQLFCIKKNYQTILLTGGSQGAMALNDAIKPILELLLRRYQIIHITGEYGIKEFTNIKNNLPNITSGNYHPFSFLEKGMESAVKVSDIVISRAGSSIFEFCASGLPMILVPLPSAAGGHQYKNAEIITKEGAAVSIRQNHLTTHRLRDVLETLLKDKHRLNQMKKFAYDLAKPDSADRVVRVIEEYLE